MLEHARMARAWSASYATRFPSALSMRIRQGNWARLDLGKYLDSQTGILPSDWGDPLYDVGEGSVVGEPASARPSRFEMEGREQRVSSIGGDGGGRGCLS